VFAFALPVIAQTPDSLTFFRNFFVTGDYVAAGVGLRGQGDVTGYATNAITISGVPANAVVVAAYLYWETMESTSTPSSGNAFFQGYPIIGKPIGGKTTPCWSSGGGTGSSSGSKSLRVYRADVKPYMVVNGNYTANGTFQVRARDSGSAGNGGTPLTEGASLVVVYQTAHATQMRSVVIYDGAYTMNNGTPSMNVDIKGFYQALGTPGNLDGKLTHIVGDGQANFGETLTFNNGGFMADNPFVGSDGFSWDTKTFAVNVPDDVDHVTTQVGSQSNNADCLSWGAVVFSTPVKDQDQDGLLDRWEQDHGYNDMDGSHVSLPDSHVNEPDIYVQLDYLKSNSHSHLLKLDAINTVGQAFLNRGIHLHVDAGTKYPASTFVIGNGSGGNAIDEGSLTCTDSGCQFPNVAGVVSWKGGVHALKNQYFPNGRRHSYRYALSGHALGFGSTSWSIADQSLVNITCCQTSGNQSLATVTTASPHGLASGARVTVGGVVSDWDLNGTYLVQSAASTTFTIAVSNVTQGTYGSFSSQLLGVDGLNRNEPSLAVYTSEITSMSGIADLPGADMLLTLGPWRADDPAGCQADPSVALSAGQTYCNDQVGSALVQAGTWMHEMGHTLMLFHGGYYESQGAPTELGHNCKSNHVSVMNYLFQIRGIPGGIVDYSGQNLQQLNETTLNESQGLGTPLSAYGTRWYAPVGNNFVDSLLQNSTGGRIAKRHCDGSPTQPSEQMVRMEALSTVGGIDWNNDGFIGGIVPSQDVNFNGLTNDTDMLGYNDWAAIDLRHLGARRNVAGFSVDTISSDVLDGGNKIIGGGNKIIGGGADVFIDDGSGNKIIGGGNKIIGGGNKIIGGGSEVTFEDANATVDAPSNLTATAVAKTIVLNWSRPGFGQIRTYYIWRADITKVPMSPTNPPINIGSVSATGKHPPTTFTDRNPKTNVMYRYFVTGALGPESGVNNGNQSGPSNTIDILAKF
jgi:hypothetical protein